MKRFRRWRLCIAFALGAEFVMGMAGELTPRHELFPFASWFLFLLVPYRAVDYDLVLTAEGDRPIEPPVSFSRAAGRVRAPHSIVYFQLIQQLGRAEERGDALQSHALRQQLDPQFIPSAVRYDLVKVTSDPVERWKTGQVIDRRTLRSFTTWEQ